jgi:putative membrane protein
MKFLRKLLTVVVLLAALAVGMLFALQNKTEVPLDLLVYTFEPRSLALWVLSAFAIGGIFGMLACSVILLRQRASLGAANRRLARSRSEVGKLQEAATEASDL